MPKKLMAETEATVRALDKTGDVGHDETAIVAQSDNAEVWGQRRERVISNFRPSRGNPRDERRLTGIGKPDESDVGEQFQFEPEIFDLARLARLDFSRRAVRRARELRLDQP